MERKKIVHIITRLDKGGSAENTVLTCRMLDPKKYDVTLFCGRSTFTPPAVPFTLIQLPSLVRSISPANDLKTLLLLRDMIKAVGPDIVHTHSSKAGIVGRWAAKLAGVRHILHTPHGHVFYGYEFNRLKAMAFVLLEKISALITGRLIALTEGEKKETLAYGIGSPEQWEIIHSGVDIGDIQALMKDCRSYRASNRKQLGIPDEAVVIGSVARLEHVKGMRYFVEAARIAHDSLRGAQPFSLFFLIVGDGGEMEMLKAMAKNYGLEKNVIFAGMRHDVFEIMMTMDVYIQPSLNEGMGKTIIQAQAVGLPVIATRVQGIPDTLTEGKTGTLVPPKDPRALAEAMLTLVRNESLRKAMGAAALAWTEELVDGYPRFSSARMVYLLEKLYDKLPS